MHAFVRACMHACVRACMCVYALLIVSVEHVLVCACVLFDSMFACVYLRSQDESVLAYLLTIHASLDQFR